MNASSEEEILAIFEGGNGAHESSPFRSGNVYCHWYRAVVTMEILTNVAMIFTDDESIEKVMNASSEEERFWPSSKEEWAHESSPFRSRNIGRGFIGLLLSQAGYEVCFIDVNEELVSELKARGSIQPGQRRTGDHDR